MHTSVGYNNSFTNRCEDLKMNSKSLPLLGLIMTCVACGDASQISEEMTTESDEKVTETQLPITTTGTWVATNVGFGPCPVLPSICTVGDVITAHTGPGNAGGCYVHECMLLGTWVRNEPWFGPCPVLPSICTVGDVIVAHSGPGTAGGCYIHECL
jgi:fatty acid-binding protein DegV